MAMAKNLKKYQEVDIFDINYWKNTAEARKTIIKWLCLAIAVLTIGYVFVIQVGVAWNKKIDDQSTMLCNSAIVSGNLEWRNNCQEYYQTGSVQYLRYMK